MEFSEGFTDLHTRAYQDILDGGGFGLEDAKPAIDLAYRFRIAEVETPNGNAHPWLLK